MIAVVAGYIGSGKTTYAKKLAESSGRTFVEVSDIVKKITQQTTRFELQGRPELASRIVEEIKSYGDDLVVSGVRQVEILWDLDSSIAQVFWLEVPRKIRLKRVLSRGDEKDSCKSDAALYAADNKDESLGLHEVRKWVVGSLKGRVILNFDESESDIYE